MLSASILLDPLPRHLLILLAVILVLIRNARLHRIVRVRLDQEVPRHVEHGDDLIRRLPLVGAEHTQAHGALVVVGNVRVVDLGLETETWRLEWVVGREDEEEFEVAALVRRLVRLKFRKANQKDVDLLHRRTGLGRPSRSPTCAGRHHRVTGL